MDHNYCAYYVDGSSKTKAYHNDILLFSKKNNFLDIHVHSIVYFFSVKHDQPALPTTVLSTWTRVAKKASYNAIIIFFNS